MQKIVNALTAWARSAARAYRDAQTRRSIAHLDEHLLRDIGLWDGRR